MKCSQRWMCVFGWTTVVAICGVLGATVNHTNVIVMLADNLGYDDVGIFQERTNQTTRTPNLDKVAREGRRFLNWNSPAVLCSASRAALLTGKYPVRTGIYPRVFAEDAVHGLLPNETTLAEYLKGAGYTTKIVGKWHLGQRPEYLPTNQGFDEWFGIPYHMSGGSLDQHVCSHQKDPNRTKWLPLFEGKNIVEQPVVLEDLAPRYVSESIRFLQQNKDRPFFLYLAFSHVHQLCAPRHSECQWASTHFRRNHSSYNATFGDAVEEMDWIAGKVLSALSNLGLEEDTLVLFTSDNGPWTAEQSCAGSKGPFLGQWLADHVRDCVACPSEYHHSPLPHKPMRCVLEGYEIDGVPCGEDTGLGSAWEANVRMPAFVKWPNGRIPPNASTHEMVTTLDVLPTVLGLLGIPHDPLDGLDVSDVFRGNHHHKPPSSRIIFFWRDGFSSGPLPQPFGRFDVVAMKIDSIKLWIWTKSSHYNADPEVYHDPPLLFDVQKDPAESKPLDPMEYEDLIAYAKEKLLEHKESIDWIAPLCLEKDPLFAPCVNRSTNCRTKQTSFSSLES